MRKQDLIKAVVEHASLSSLQADDAVSSALEHMTNALARGESVNLVGFGAFTVSSRPARIGRHPTTGESLPLPASNNVCFRAGKTLRERVNQNTEPN